MKKLLSVLLILVMVFTFAACGNNGDSGEGGEGEAVTLVLGGAASGDTNPYIKNVEWANEWLQKNGSNITIDASWGSVLGSETELAQNVALGSVDMFSIADMSTTGIAPKMAFGNFPGLFADYDAVNEAWS